MSRVSSDEQAKRFSLGIQEEQLRSHCQRNNIEVVKHFKEDHSAKDFNRPEFKKLFAFAKENKNEIDYLFVTTWDRFSRNLFEALSVQSEFKKLGIEIQAINSPIDQSTPESLMFLSMQLSMAQIDNERRSIKVKEGMRAALKAGQWNRSAPYGYKNTRDENKRPLIIPDERAIYIEEAFIELSKGKSQSQVRTELNKKGAGFSKSNFNILIKNPVYMGKIVVPELDDEPETMVEGKHEGIVSEKLFYNVQDKINSLTSKLKQPKFKTLKEELPLRSFLYCSKCNKKMTGSASRSSSGDRHYYYHCNHCKKERYRADKANDVFIKILEDFEFSQNADELYQLMVKNLLGGGEQEKKRKVVKLNKEISDLTNRIQNIQNLLADAKIDFNTFGEMNERFTKSLTDKKQEVESLSTTDFEFKKWLKVGISNLSNISKLYVNASVQDKQQLISSIFPENIEFYKNKCRTSRINDVLRCILQIDKKLSHKKRGHFSKYLKISSLVGLLGLEPRTTGPKPAVLPITP